MTDKINIPEWEKEAREWLAEAALAGLRNMAAIARESGVPYDTLRGIFRKNNRHAPSNETRRKFKAAMARLRREAEDKI